MGIQAAYSRLGIVLVLVFTGFPFVVRTIQPVLGDLDAEFEEAAAVLGASRWQTFRKVILPTLVPPALHGWRRPVPEMQVWNNGSGRCCARMMSNRNFFRNQR